ncbi:MAG: phosphodiester glycosidase family protein [Chlamydiales bacterium]|nr:phosphodiester glycosidase family protein [Chlamydiales bacterium]
MKHLIHWIFLPCFLFGNFEIRELEGPNIAYILTIDPNLYKMKIGLAQDSGLGLESVPSIAHRYSGFAAINGGFFLGDPYLGGAAGLLKIQNILFATSVKNRGVIAWNANSSPVIERVKSTVTINNVQITGLNCPRKQKDIVLYSRPFHQHTLTDAGGWEYTLNTDHNVTAIMRTGNATIPENGYILSVGPDAQTLSLNIGDHVDIRIDIQPLLGKTWLDYENILGGTPVLIHQGKVIDDYGPEQILDNFSTHRFSRSAVGIRSNGELVFVVVDGHSEKSIGMTLKELSSFMNDLGCIDALNLDGGGSSTIFYDNQVQNIPSTHKNRPSPVGNALLILKINSHDMLAPKK